MSTQSAGSRTACRSCGSTALPIVYGLPSDRAMAAAERGELRLGGCALPHWKTCRRCGNAVSETAARRLPGLDLPVPDALGRLLRLGRTEAAGD